MYRYGIDNSLTCNCEDLVLFRESPFASWMERLTLENPGHGILPDKGSEPPRDCVLPQDDVAASLRAEGHQVALVEWEDEEPLRRNATLLAMRHGADFIVNGQLAAGSLSGAVNLLMKIRGHSELGQHLYVPCDTQGKISLHSPYRLCFLADLLQSLQGELPPRMLVIHGGAEPLPLHTDDHIHFYRAVKRRFLEAQQQFRKHRMPDPALSAHAGRWSVCANEVLKQRALQSVALAERAAGPEDQFAGELPLAGELPQLVSARAGAGLSSYDPDWVAAPGAGGIAGQAWPDTAATGGSTNTGGRRARDKEQFHRRRGGFLPPGQIERRRRPAPPTALGGQREPGLPGAGLVSHPLDSPGFNVGFQAAPRVDADASPAAARREEAPHSAPDRLPGTARAPADRGQVEPTASLSSSLFTGDDVPD